MPVENAAVCKWLQGFFLANACLCNKLPLGICPKFPEGLLLRILCFAMVSPTGLLPGRGICSINCHSISGPNVQMPVENTAVCKCDFWVGEVREGVGGGKLCWGLLWEILCATHKIQW